jgi:RimJ/RimL family protein N-acetyltransferase
VSDPLPSAMPVPREIRTPRLLLRPWHPDDAGKLAPVLTSNRAHLSPWIPRRVWEPAAVPALAERLAGFAAEFEATREWRYAIFALDDDRVLGEVALFPRSASGRAPLVQADRCEIGYWLREDATGGGLATESARAMLSLAASIPLFAHVEIRCDARNAASAAIPHRLGFALASTEDDTGKGAVEPVMLQVWVCRLSDSEVASE